MIPQAKSFAAANFNLHHDESLWGLQTDFPKRLAALEKLAQVPASPFSSSAMAFFGKKNQPQPKVWTACF